MSEHAGLENSPAERRRQKVRGAILEAAERVFAVEGEAGLSIRRLADAIDYSPSAIYKYFGSKDELVDELKEAFFGRLMSGVDQAAFKALPFGQRIRRCFMTYIEVATERPHHYLAAFSSPPTAIPAPGGQDWEAFQQTQKGRAFGTVVSVVRDGQATGVFDVALDPVQAARSLWASMHGLSHLLINHPNFAETVPAGSRPMSDETFTAYHVDMMVRSLEPRSPKTSTEESPDV